MDFLKKYLLIFIVFIIALSVSFFIFMEKEQTGISASEVAPERFSKGAYFFRYSMSGDIVFRLTEEETRTSVSVDGTLQMRVYDVQDKVVKAGFCLSPVSVMTGGGRDAGLEMLYSTHFLADMDMDGRFIRFYLPSGIAHAEAKALKNLMQSLEVIFSEDESYTEEQTDALGSYQALYEMNGATVNKTKKTYDKVTASYLGYDSLSIHPREFSCAFTPAVDGGWLDSVYIRETLDISAGGRDIVSAHTKISVQRRTGIRLSVSGLKDSYEEEKQALQTGKHEPAAERSGDVFDLKNIGDKNSREISIEFKRYIIQNPEYTAQIPKMLKREALTDAQRREIINVLGLAGTEVAQKALTDISSDASQRGEDRFRAAVSMGSVDVPLTDGAERYLLSQCGKAAYDKTGAAAAAVLSAGSVVKNLRENYPEEAKALADKIVYELRSADEKNINYVLASLGNTAMAEYEDVITPYLDSGSPQTRAAAAESLKYMPGESVSETLGSMLTDGDALVRMAAARTLTARTVNASVISDVISVSRTESNTNVRHDIIKILTADKDNPAAAQAMRDMLASEKSKENIKMILEAVGTD
ncbi:MAG: HEAT repeat domain-containing protein [Deferribacterales bacterium]